MTNVEKWAKDFKEEVTRLTVTYGTSETHAGCYLSNYGDRCVCSESCGFFEECKKISEKDL